MATSTSCRFCGENVPRSTTDCPRCGYPQHGSSADRAAFKAELEALQDEVAQGDYRILYARKWLWVHVGLYLTGVAASLVAYATTTYTAHGIMGATLCSIGAVALSTVAGLAWGRATYGAHLLASGFEIAAAIGFLVWAADLRGPFYFGGLVFAIQGLLGVALLSRNVSTWKAYQAAKERLERLRSLRRQTA